MTHSVRQQYGFTLLELLVVIAIIGVLAAVVVASLNASRGNARNAAVLSQMAEYEKALGLYYLEFGEYPTASFNTTRVMCFGDGAVGDCVTPAFGNPTAATESLITGLSIYLSALPIFEQGTHSGEPRNSPAYSGGGDSYNLYFMLEGSNQDCGRAVVDDPTDSGGQFTLCILSP